MNRPTVTDARRRLLLGVAGVGLTALAVRRDRVGGHEAAAFRAVNDLPDVLFGAAWPVMQAGTLGAAPVSALLAATAGRDDLARRLLAGGTATWVLAKVVKRGIQRPRPVDLVPGAHCRGSAANGAGYVSGHAGVAVALGMAMLPDLGPAGRAAVLAAMATVGLARVYVGAHLPLDVLGGAALGLAVDGLLELHVTRR